MKFQTLTCVGAALLLASTTGCSILGLSSDKTEKNPATEAAAPEPEPRAGEDLLKAFLDNDAEKFLSMLPDIVREEFGTVGFEKTVESMKEQLGTPVSYEFVFNLEHPKFTVSIWKVRFERDNTDKTQKIYQEALFRAVSGEVDGQEKLLGFNFF